MVRYQSAIRVAALLSALVACDGSRRTVGPDVELRSAAVVAVDEPVRLAFVRPIDPASVFAATLSIEAIAGPGVGVPPRGVWRVAGEDAVEFVPELPSPEPAPTPFAGGLQPATRYLVRVAGGNEPAALRFANGERLVEPRTFEVTTRAGAVADVFASQRPGGPKLVAASAAPRDGDGRWRIGRLADRAELRLTFDQPLDPRFVELAGAPPIAPFELRYDDPQFGPDTPIAIDVDLESNTVNGAVVVLRPRGVLPTSATVRVGIPATLRDLFGDPRGAVAPASEPPTAVATEDTYEPLFDALLVDFARAADLGEPDFPEAGAAVGDGALRVPVAFPAMDGIGDLHCSADTVLSTDVQELDYTNALPRSFTGGVLHVHNLQIDAGALVRGIGSNPLVLVVHGDAQIDGVLSVRGSDGMPSGPTYQGPGDAVPPGLAGLAFAPGLRTPGGVGGGDGGLLPRLARCGWQAPGAGPDGAAAGGSGGAFSCESCSRSSGGGGGAMATAGDPWFPAPAGVGTSFVQRRGDGGYGCSGTSGSSSRTLVGGSAGVPLVDGTDPDDDFLGRSYDPRTGRSRVGELAAPIGGGGGGAGGNWGANLACDPERPTGVVGGAGGGGGGAVVLQVRGTLTIGPAGRIVADGGHGTIPTTVQGAMGGGGGGAGGMVVLMAREIVLHTKGETFANHDYSFVVSADGGVTRSPFWTPTVYHKYPANGLPVVTGPAYDDAPLGGFGGMGIVQLMVPPGTDNADGTNTVLDDHVTIVRNGAVLAGAEKQRFLGWSGFRADDGSRRDDFGMPITALGGQGDIRPAPLLLPLPYTTDGSARARSRWLPLGARQRRALSAPDGASRGVIGDVLRFESPTRNDGFVPFTIDGRLSRSAGTTVFPAAIPVVRSETAVPFRGRTAHRLDLDAVAFAGDSDRYTGYVAEVITGPSRVWLRVVGSAADTLWLDADEPLPKAPTAVQLRASFVDVDAPLLPTSVAADGTSAPVANVRIGFAFHRSPATASGPGPDSNRFPSDPREWLFDLGDTSLLPQLRAFGPSHLQWDVRFVVHDPPPLAGASPDSAAIALRRLYLPIRF